MGGGLVDSLGSHEAACPQTGSNQLGIVPSFSGTPHCAAPSVVSPNVTSYSPSHDLS